MARTQTIRPSPKAEALNALQVGRTMLKESGAMTPFMMETLGSILAHVATQLELVQEVSRPRKVKPTRPEHAAQPNNSAVRIGTGAGA